MLNEVPVDVASKEYKDILEEEERSEPVITTSLYL